jgi:hypothetical protein
MKPVVTSGPQICAAFILTRIRKCQLEDGPIVAKRALSGANSVDHPTEDTFIAADKGKAFEATVTADCDAQSSCGAFGLTECRTQCRSEYRGATSHVTRVHAPSSPVEARASRMLF